LGGEIRPVFNGEERLREAAKQGFKLAAVPKANRPRAALPGLEVMTLERIDQLDQIV
jgi:DNA repair protein RadA/Sms